MDIRLVAMDLDGTLLGPDKQISPENARALRACEARGIKMVLASGRNFESVRTLALGVGLSSPIITANGARVDMSPNGPMLIDYPFDKSLARHVYDILADSAVYFVLYTRERVFKCNTGCLEEPEEGVFVSVTIDKNQVFPFEVRDNPRRTMAEGLDNTYKFVAYSPDEAQLKALRDRIARETDCSLSSSWFDNVEVLRPGAGKGLALRDLSRKLGVKKSQVMAFGDNLNDLDMLENAGVPIAMENAVERLKAVARHIAPHHGESGVGRMLTKLVLGGEGA